MKLRSSNKPFKFDSGTKPPQCRNYGIESRSGTYHSKEVYHYIDIDSKLNVMVDKNSKRFISAWKLSPRQLEHLLEHGNLGGG